MTVPMVLAPPAACARSCGVGESFGVGRVEVRSGVWDSGWSASASTSDTWRATRARVAAT